jgi:hypothetical protein
VSGPSGIGKSTLVRRFLGQIVASHDVVVLSGRCYENESVPYRALDGVVDGLSRRLASLPADDVEGLLPPDAAALMRLFPVLRQVRAIAAAQAEQAFERADLLSLRRRSRWHPGHTNPVTLSACARSALAMAAKHGPHRRFLSIARAGARRIASERMTWSDPIALLLSAAVAYLEGGAPLAVRCLDDAVERFDGADMKLYAAVARRRIGARLEDARGREMKRQADEWMAVQNIKNPAAMTRTLAPGLGDRP